METHDRDVNGAEELTDTVLWILLVRIHIAHMSVEWQDYMN